MKQLYTEWGEALDPENVLPEYPRPQLVRDTWKSLNGYWEYTFTKKTEAKTGDVPLSFRRQRYVPCLLVPFSPESALSGAGRQLQPDELLWYRRTFDLDEMPAGRLLLHFGAVDQTCTVWVNGQEAGSHVGGYLAFKFDITKLVRPGENELVVKVSDDSDTSYHARGKQRLRRGGMYYTATSGIWQTVWLEWVPVTYVTRVFAETREDLKTVALTVMTNRRQAASALLEVGVPVHCEDDESEVEFRPWLFWQIKTGEPFEFALPEARLWTPDSPWLYPVRIRLEGPCGGDEVLSYFAVRTFTLEKQNGEDFPRVCLNHEPVFQKGVLDQGYWPDGLLTAPSDAAMIFDLREMKKTGFNMVRKHVKIEPDRWYYHCDRLGLIVWQDIVNGGGPVQSWYVTYLATAMSWIRLHQSDKARILLSRTDPEGRREFEHEMRQTIRQLKGHPSICCWVIFNEGWGQFETKRMAQIARNDDPTRLLDPASGWFDQGVGDFMSVHNYFRPLAVWKDKKRANALTEFGGKTFVIEDHNASEELYGYGDFKSLDELQEAYDALDAEMTALIPQGLCVSIYTQWTDIEDEANGIYTYDRKVRKICVNGDGSL